MYWRTQNATEKFPGLMRREENRGFTTEGRTDGRREAEGRTNSNWHLARSIPLPVGFHFQVLLSRRQSGLVKAPA